jgi:hypothetical protein
MVTPLERQDGQRCEGRQDVVERLLVCGRRGFTEPTLKL